MAFKVIALLVIAFTSPASPVLTERQAIKESNTTYASSTECRNALQHSTGNFLASATNQLNKWADEYEPPAGYTFHNKRLAATCVPSTFPTGSNVRLD